MDRVVDLLHRVHECAVIEPGQSPVVILDLLVQARTSTGRADDGAAGRSRRRASQASGASDDALHPAGRERSLDLVLELLREHGEVERPRDPAEHRAALLGEADGGLEELLHLQRRAHLDADERVTVADVREVVLLAGRDDDRLAGPRDDPLASQLEAHRALDDLEALLLTRVNVLAARDPPVRRKLEVDRQQLAARGRRRLAERDALSAGRVLECLSDVCHAVHLLAQNVRVHLWTVYAEIHARSSTALDDQGAYWRHGALDPFPPADPLGEALHFLRMNGAYYCRSELTAPWGLTLPPMPGYLWFHVVTSGRLWLETGDGGARLDPAR